jgi:hypothetical protein
MEASTLNSVREVAAYLAAAPGGTIDTPVALPPLVISLAADWTDLLDAIDNAGKYVSLDLSGCDTTGMTATPGDFAPNFTIFTGKRYITGLILPNDATSINYYDESRSAFYDFESLKSISGNNTTTIGDWVFGGCTALTTVSFPAATTIGEGVFLDCTALTTVSLPAATTIKGWAFQGCTTLTTVSFPAATTIGYGAFMYCTALTTVSLPAATTIGEHIFNSCTALTTVSFPAATTIGNFPFWGCTALTTVSLPAATTIGEGVVFFGCTALTTVSLPAATTIGDWAFEGCTALTTVSFPAATTIGQCAFSRTGTGNLTVTLGSTVPTLGGGIFQDVPWKNVTVYVPSGAATGYDTYWQDNFKGWNTNINLTLATY